MKKEDLVDQESMPGLGLDPLWVTGEENEGNWRRVGMLRTCLLPPGMVSKH